MEAIQSREYMTGLLRRRSVVALCCCVLTLALAFYGITAGVNRTITVLGVNGFVSFTYYTMLANTLAALSAAFVLPFAVEGIRRRRFTLPGWVAAAHYVAAVSITIMLVFVLAFMSWAVPENAFGNDNIVTHVFCPALILISFFQMENGYIYSLKDRLLGIVPFLVYGIVYSIEVWLIGEANGGWLDIYQIKAHMPPALAIPVLLLIGFCVSTGIAAVSNRLTKKRTEKTFRYWSSDADPVEIRIEAYGLGRMAGLSSGRNGVTIPVDLLRALEGRCGLEPEALARPYLKGLVNGLGEKAGENRRRSPSPRR